MPGKHRIIKAMNCRDFREIADSYLSNELLVETNHEVLRHLENCADCRRELASRRNLREKLREAVKRAPQSRINPAFAFKLKTGLRENAFRLEKTWSFIGAKTILAGAVAILVLSLALGLIWRKPAPEIANVKPDNTSVTLPRETFDIRQADFAEVRKDAVDDHKNCALTYKLKERPISLDEAAITYGAANKDFDTTVIKTLREVFGDKVKLVKAHNCLINGRRFAHVIVEFQNKIVSVLMTGRENGDELSDSDAISCQSSDSLQIACLESGKFSIFVVSDLPETDNLFIARTIAPSLKKHIIESGRNA